MILFLMEVTSNCSDEYFLSERTTIKMNEEGDDRSPISTNQRKNIWLSLGRSIFQGFCKPMRNDFTSDDDEEENDRDGNDHFASSGFSNITTLVTRQPSPNYYDYYYGSTQSMLELWVAACVLLGWTIRVLQYKDTSLALTTAVANKF